MYKLKNKPIILLIISTILLLPFDLNGFFNIARASTHTLSISPQNDLAQISLSWTDYPGATGYHIYRTTNQGVTRLNGSTPLSTATTSYVDTNNIQDNVLYHYEVAAIINGQEVLSNPQSLYSKVKPFVSTDPTIIATPSSNYVDLSWGSSTSSDVSYYEIYRNGSVVGYTTQTQYRDIGRNGSTAYTFNIKAVDKDGIKSDFYTENSVTTLAMGSTNQTLTLLTEDFANQWTKTGTNTADLTLGTNATWSKNNCDYCTTNANADLMDAFAFTIQPNQAGGSNAKVTFTWTKDWGNDNNKSNGENLDLYVDYAPKNSQTWTNKWSETATNKGTGTQTVDLTNVAGDHKIRFRVSQRTSSEGKGDWARTVIDNVDVKLTYTNTAPGTPTSVAAGNVNGNQVSLTWAAPSDVDLAGYYIYRKLATDLNYPSSPIATTNMNSFVDPTASSDTQYSYKVVAVDNGNLSSTGTSNEVSVTAGQQASKDETPPSAPSNLLEGIVGPSSVELFWNASNSDDIKNYVVMRSYNSGLSYSAVGTPSVATLVDKNLVEPQTEYFYRILAVDNEGNVSAGSNVRKVTTPAPDSQPPTVPANFQSISIGETFVKFTWDASTDNYAVDHYEIQAKTGTDPWETKKTFNAPAVSGTVDGLLPGTTYSFQILAVDTSGNKSNVSAIQNPITTNLDVTAPNILLKKPYDGTEGVGTKQFVQVKFDDYIDSTTVTPDTYYVVRAGTTTPKVAGSFLLTPTDNPKEIKFVPTNPLLANTQYEVHLLTGDAGIKNISGTPLIASGTTVASSWFDGFTESAYAATGDTVSWTFTTGSTEFTKPHGNYIDKTDLCKNCHNAHTGERPRLLNKAEIYDVCFTCHDGTGSTFNVKDQFMTNGAAKSSHHPVFATSNEENVRLTCVSCHNPHDSGKNLNTGLNNPLWPRLLNSFNKGNPSGTPSVPPTAAHDGNEVCWNCHGNTGNLMNSKNYAQYSQGYLDGGEMINAPLSGQSYEYRTDHQRYFPTVSTLSYPSNNGAGHGSSKMETKKGSPESSSGTGIRCVACHQKHGSDVKPLLRNDIVTPGTPDSNVKNGKEFCYQCHTPALEYAYSDNTETAQNNFDGKDVNEARGHAQFDCQVCHNPHGSPYPNYLRLNYRVDTTSFRNFQTKDAELCFDCHDQTKLFNQGASVRGRTGNLPAENYHNFHVNNSDGKTIQATCKNCHRPHGSIDAENGNTNRNHRVGFPNSQVSGSRQYNRDASADNSRPGGSGSCNLTCHGREHSNFNYDGAYRDGSNISGFNVNNAYQLKDNWKTESVLLNTRPDGTGVYDLGNGYKIDYRNGADSLGNKTHFRDQGSTPGDGYFWK